VALGGAGEMFSATGAPASCFVLLEEQPIGKTINTATAKRGARFDFGKHMEWMNTILDFTEASSKPAVALL
jgi:hypothetical protein